MQASGDMDTYGQELDFELHGKWFKKSKIVLGSAITVPSEVWNSDNKPEYTLYFMPIFNF